MVHTDYSFFCVWKGLHCVCRIQNLHWELNRLQQGNDCCCETISMFPTTVTVSTNSREPRQRARVHGLKARIISDIPSITPRVKCTQLGWKSPLSDAGLLSVLMILEGNPLTLSCLFQPTLSSVSLLCAAVAPWHCVQHSSYSWEKVSWASEPL